MKVERTPFSVDKRGQAGRCLNIPLGVSVCNFYNRKGAVLRAAPSSELIVVVVKRNILQHALRFINVNIGDGWQVIGAMPVAFVFHA